MIRSFPAALLVGPADGGGLCDLRAAPDGGGHDEDHDQPIRAVGSRPARDGAAVRPVLGNGQLRETTQR